jgi:membrane-bound lytic murein transglycosylase F
LRSVASGDAHIGVGGLYVAPPARDGAAGILWTQPTYAIEPVVIYHLEAAKPRSFRDLANDEVAHTAGLDALIAAHDEVIWHDATNLSHHALIAQVSDGDIDYAVVPAADAFAMRNMLPGYDIAFAADRRRDLAWAVAPQRRALLEDLDRFLAAAREERLVARLASLYFEPPGQVERIDAAIFRDRVRTDLARYRSLFEQAQAASSIEWRLVAAIAYQESQWDPSATSETGVRGFMQITEETATQLRVADRLDPAAATLAAARYLATLKAKLPARIAEPDRTWLALAAFNIGAGHLEDARVLAQRQKLNPDLWSDVRQALPLLALPEHYELAKNGYARGGMPVVFVDRVRAFHDILLRQAPPRSLDTLLVARDP